MAEIKKPQLVLSSSRLSDYVALFKLRLSLLVLLTTCLGFSLGAVDRMNLLLLLPTMLGMALVAASGCALNQLMERDIDAAMERTASRPLPMGRLQPGDVLWIGIFLGILGVTYLSWSVSPLCGFLGAFTWGSYVMVYTPMKKRTHLAALVGAIPGAMPPVIGWVAARGTLDAGGYLLFGILFLWQLPHFYAIAWIYRDEYARARIPVLAVCDPDGRRTAIHTALWCTVLLFFSLLPTVLGLAGNLYLAGAILLGLAYLLPSVGLLSRCTEDQARLVFRVSLIYLPLLLGLLALDRLPL